MVQYSQHRCSNFEGGSQMNLELGEKIRGLRRQQNRTQENLADALGVTGQAVSRWEQGLSYPDMELIPPIANYFGITIDELFGYENDREKKIAAVIAKVDELDSENLGSDRTFDACIRILREALAEFPANEKLTYRLGHLLNEAGWARADAFDGKDRYDDEGYIRYGYDAYKKSAEWSEAVKLLEHLVETSSDHEIVHKSIVDLVCIYRVTGDVEKGIKLADRLPKISQSREILLADGTDGKTQAKYLGESLIELTYVYVEQMMYALVNNIRNYDTEMPIEKVNGAISLFGLICDDGNFGIYHREVAFLYLYLSRLEWQYGRHDEAFESLDNALDHAKKYDSFVLSDEPHYTAPLVKDADVEYDCFRDDGHFAEHLSEDWPMWCNPDYAQVKAEMTSDVRWSEWVKRTKSPQDDRPCLTQPLN